MEEWACPLCARRRGGLRTAAQRAAPTKFASAEAAAAARYLPSAQPTVFSIAVADLAWDPKRISNVQYRSVRAWSCPESCSQGLLES